MPYGFNDDKSLYDFENTFERIDELYQRTNLQSPYVVTLNASGVTTTGRMIFRRIGYMVFVTFNSNVNVATANNTYLVGTIPVGFRPLDGSQVYWARGIVGNTISNTSYRITIGTVGNITYTASATGNITASCSLAWCTADAPYSG